MKKLQFIFIFLTTLLAHAQNFWTENSTEVPYLTGIRSISIVDQNTTWLNMYDATIGEELRIFSRTVNGGASWTPGIIDLGTHSDDLGISYIHGVSSLVAYAAVFQNAFGVQGGICKTEDGGITWVRQPSAAFLNTNSVPYFVYFWNENEGLAVGNAVDGYFEIYITSNGGDFWTRLASTPTIVPLSNQEYLVQNVFEVNENTIWVGTSSGRILKSTDRGHTWTVTQSPILDFGAFGTSSRFAFSNLLNGLLQTSDMHLYKTNDGGTTWTEVFYTGVIRNGDITAVPGLSNTYISVGFNNVSNERGSSYTVDNGNTWTSINNNPDTNFVNGGEIAMFNQDHGFAGGFSSFSAVGGIFNWGGGTMLRQAVLAVETYSVNQSVIVAPNPTKDIINIAGKNIIQIELTDIVGKCIAKTNYNKTDSVTLNLDFLGNGIYFIYVANDQGISFRKVIKH